jgi:hypothetical protein
MRKVPKSTVGQQSREGLGTMIKNINIELTESNSRSILQALSELKEKCQKVIDDEDGDEDEQFFFANDLMEANLIFNEIKKEAVDTFGESVLNFSHDTL